MKIPKNKISGEIRNIRLSPLFEKDKRYNIDRSSEKYQKEDQNGTMCPNYNHCWLSWEQKFYDEEEQKNHWFRHAELYKTIEEAKKDIEELNK